VVGKSEYTWILVVEGPCGRVRVNRETSVKGTMMVDGVRERFSRINDIDKHAWVSNSRDLCNMGERMRIPLLEV
jgi:hypothetical protein